MLRKIEWAVALVATAAAVWLHFDFMRHAGGLWRDEVGTIYLATRPGLTDVFHHLLQDSFPAYWVLVVRSWVNLGLGSDHGLRVLGFLVGLAVLGAIWLNARLVKVMPPLFTLLLAVNPTLIVWGDSMRATGWGTLWIVLTYGLVWRVLEDATAGSVLCATLAAICAVHSTYYNWIMLFAFCCAGALVAARRGQWKRGALILGIGAAAALTAVPYVIGILHLNGHYLITQRPFDLGKFFSRLEAAFSEGGPAAIWVWGLLCAGAVAFAIFCLLRPHALAVAAPQKDLLLYSVAALAIGVPGYYAFLKVVSFGTEPWYYATLLTAAALTIDSMFAALANVDWGRKARLALVIAALALVLPPDWRTVPVRMTNTDLIAAELAETAATNDLILVNPWYCGISFQYYYDGYAGRAPWLTLPPVEDHTYHCYESIVRVMTQPDQLEVLRPVFDRIEATLKAGNRVWLVGGLEYPPPGQKPAPLPAAPNGPNGWENGPYQELWSVEAGWFVQAHAKRYQEFTVPPDGRRINPAEFLPLQMVQGWRE
jgi:hypothetical protein